MKKRPSTFPSVAVFEEFRKLLDNREQELAKELTPTNFLAHVYSGLLGSYSVADWSPSGETSAVDPLTADLRKHAAYLWLNRSASFQGALAIFRRSRSINTDQAQAALSELQFIQRILTWLGFSIHTDATGWRPQSVSAEQRRTTLKHAAQLLDDIDGGVSLKDYSAGTQLKHLLCALCSELSGRKKRDYAGTHSRERLILNTLAFTLLGHAGLESAAVVEIVREAARLYDFDVSSRSVQRYVSAAKLKRDEAIDTLGRERAQRLAKATRKSN